VGPFAHPAAGRVERAESVQSTTACKNRKDVHREVGQHFGAVPENQVSGTPMYRGLCSSPQPIIPVDCRGRVEQPRTFVALSDPRKSV